MELYLLVILFCIAALLFLLFIKGKALLKGFALGGLILLTMMLFVFTPFAPEEKIIATEADVQPYTKVIISDTDFQLIPIKDKVLIEAPHISQLPELPRGCEVTALAMLLGSAGVEIDKMQLAEEVRKDPTPRTVKNGKIYYGNPHRGFVGDMYTKSRPGLSVYHEPILELAEKYLPGRMINLTGQSFEELKIPLSDGRPVWVMINVEYRELEDHYFKTWHTPDGKIQVTRKVHSVLITGYDEDYVYFNDPLTTKNRKEPIHDFARAWVQMGSQALTYQ